MTTPIPRKFSQVLISCRDSKTEQEVTNFDPRLLSTSDLEKVCKSLESLKMQVFMEMARRCGVNRRPEGFYVPPVAGVSGSSSSRNRRKNERVFDLSGLEDLDLEL